MKKLCMLVSMIFLSSLSYGQKVVVDEGLESLGDGYNNAIRVFVPHTNEKTLTKKWNEFLKNNHAKVKSGKSNTITGLYTVINGISPDSMTVYSKITEFQSGFQVAAVFQKGNEYIASSNHPKESSMIQGLLKQWGTEISKEALLKKLEDEEDVLKGQNKNKRNLEGSTKSLEENNESMKKQIAENEVKIEENKQKLLILQSELGKQTDIIDGIKAKQFELQ